MEPKGVFEIHVSPEGHRARIGWMEGVPYIMNLGGAAQVWVNETPIAPHTPQILRSGDLIRAGSTSVRWTGAGPDAVEPETMVAPTAATGGTEPICSIVVQTPSQIWEVPLSGDVISVGRSRDNDIHLDDEHVSRHHARLLRRPHGYEIADLGSEFGVRVGGEGAAQRMLQDGDVAWLSNRTSLTFKVRQPIVPVEDGRAGPDGLDATKEVSSQPATVEILPQPEETEVIARRDEPMAAPDTPIIRAPETVDLSKAEEVVEADATLLVPKKGEEQPDEPELEETVLVDRKAAMPSLPDAQEADVTLPGEWEGPAPEPELEATVLVSRPSAEPRRPEGEDATLLVPKSPAPAQGAVPLTPEAVLAGDIPDDVDDAVRETAYIDMLRLVEEEPERVFEPTTMARDTQVPHLVVHTAYRTWEVQFSKERLTIGRGEENDIVLPDRHASRQHAWIERRGDAFVVREAQSRNGIWLGKQRIREHTLRDGDVLSIGQARLVFKGGFTSDELTLISIPRVDGKPKRRPVVFVPGMMGSELWLGSERIWPNAKVLVSQPELYQLPGDPRIEARGILSDVVVVPGLIKLRQYSGLGDYMESGLGYTRGKDFLEFGYDWRHDIRLSAQKLADSIESWEVPRPITLIAHSLGTLVSRYYVEKLGGKRHIERLVLMGGPHYGTPKGLAAILNGPGMLPFGMGEERLRRILATLPSAYQILPIYPCITDQDETYIDALKDTSWLPEYQRPYLSAARSFRSELGSESSVPCVSIIGYGLKTIVRIKIHRQPSGQWEKVEFVEDTAGDQSVPSGSAVLKGSEIHPVYQEHGSLYVDNDVRMRLKIELTRSTTWQRR